MKCHDTQDHLAVTLPYPEKESALHGARVILGTAITHERDVSKEFWASLDGLPQEWEL